MFPSITSRLQRKERLTQHQTPALLRPAFASLSHPSRCNTLHVVLPRRRLHPDLFPRPLRLFLAHHRRPTRLRRPDEGQRLSRESDLARWVGRSEYEERVGEDRRWTGDTLGEVGMEGQRSEGRWGEGSLY